MQRYNYERFVRGHLMAEGVAVHANTLDEANAKAARFLWGSHEELRFVDNEPCTPALRCNICHPPSS